MARIQVRSTEPFFVTCRRKKKGPLKVAYEDIRLASENPVDNQLLSTELGGVSMDVEEMHADETCVPEDIENEDPTAAQDNSGALLGTM